LKALTLKYSEAQHHIQLSLPTPCARVTQNRHAEEFISLVARHLMVVMMFQGDVRAPGVWRICPLISISRAVFEDDVISVERVAQEKQFAEDGLVSLVERLRSAIIIIIRLAGLAMISQCYSRITFGDIANLLHIESPADDEGFCPKAAADWPIDGVD
jgi:hypothetical protein